MAHDNGLAIEVGHAGIKVTLDERHRDHLPKVGDRLTVSGEINQTIRHDDGSTTLVLELGKPWTVASQWRHDT